MLCGCPDSGHGWLGPADVLGRPGRPRGAGVVGVVGVALAGNWEGAFLATWALGGPSVISSACCSGCAVSPSGSAADRVADVLAVGPPNLDASDCGALATGCRRAPRGAVTDGTSAGATAAAVVAEVIRGLVAAAGVCDC